MKLFTGKVPFSDKTAPAAMVGIMAGERPERPNHPGFTEPLWALTQRCWGKDPRSRPKMQEVAKVLKELSALPLHQNDRISLTHHHSVASRIAKPLRTPAGEPTMMAGPSTTVSHKPGTHGAPPKGGGVGNVPYDADTPGPTLVQPPPSPRRPPGANSVSSDSPLHFRNGPIGRR